MKSLRQLQLLLKAEMKQFPLHTSFIKLLILRHQLPMWMTSACSCLHLQSKYINDIYQLLLLILLLLQVLSCPWRKYQAYSTAFLVSWNHKSNFILWNHKSNFILQIEKASSDLTLECPSFVPLKASASLIKAGKSAGLRD